MKGRTDKILKDTILKVPSFKGHNSEGIPWTIAFGSYLLIGTYVFPIAEVLFQGMMFAMETRAEGWRIHYKAEQGVPVE